MLVAQRVAMLPAFAALDWCDRAAASIEGVLPEAQACVFIVSIDTEGRIIGREAAGASAGVGEAARGRALEMRSWCERASHLCCRPTRPIPAEGITGRVSQMPEGHPWRDPCLASLWSGMASDRVVASLHAIGSPGDGRLIVAHVGSASASEAEVDAAIKILTVAGQMLAERALIALGSERATRQRWISPREQEVLQRLILGMSIREIADELGRSPHTVHDHVKTLHRKLNASSRGELISRALGTSGRIDQPAADIETKPTIDSLALVGQASPA